jgi:HEPN domain-containing protein
MMAFEREPEHWLRRFGPDEWIQASLAQIRVAEHAYMRNDAAAGLAGCKRAAGMALNGALIVEPNEAWGRSYVDHIAALRNDVTVPEAVRAACALLLDTHPPSSDVLSLRSKAADTRVLDAARDVMAHAYAVVKRHAS